MVTLFAVSIMVGGTLNAIDYSYLWVSLTEIATVGVPPTPRSKSDEKAEFDRICAQVPIAGSLSVAQLRQLIDDSLALSDQLKDSEIPQAKIWIQRLKMCRDFFEYSIEVIEGG